MKLFHFVCEKRLLNWLQITYFVLELSELWGDIFRVQTRRVSQTVVFRNSLPVEKSGVDCVRIIVINSVVSS
jgi:hypothetical protein